MSQIANIRKIFQLQVLEAAEAAGFAIPENTPLPVREVRRIANGGQVQKLVLHGKTFSLFEQMPIKADGYRKLLQYPYHPTSITQFRTKTGVMEDDTAAE